MPLSFFAGAWYDEKKKAVRSLAQFQYKTRGMSTPQGKPRVYIASHPDDHGRFFEAVSDSILHCVNCAVWYTEGAAADLEDLKQMQLIVVPVSRALLTRANFAMDAVVPFALAQHISVLPLMQEQGLEQLYQQRFGDLQYLEPDNSDPTAIGYEEKLAAYLSSVLVGEELTERIRGAFDAYAFLSYRKKDRRHAQSLMRLIHQHACCRDIAIWYDEFLVPGEDFRDGIREALEKSGLFVLAVTPNLVNEKNFVASTEYPMAVQAGKPVLPVELVPTDRAALAGTFRALPPVTAASDSRSLTGTLEQMVKDLGLPERRLSAEHDYLIGLAYLSGVDVEVDRERGVELITSAAGNGSADAMDMLVAMYHLGFGVERSREKRIQWQEQKVALRLREYEAQGSAESLERMFLDLCRCADLYREAANYPAARQRYLAAQSYLEASQFAGEPEILRSRAAVWHRLGELSRQEGDLTAAKTAVTRGIALTEQLARQTDAAKELAAGYHKLGELCHHAGEWSAAIEQFERILPYRRSRAAETGTMEARRDLMVTCNHLGASYLQLGAPETARGFYEECAALGEVLAKEAGTAASMRDLAVCYNRLTELARAEGDKAAAIRHCEQYMAVCEAAAEQSDAVEVRREWYVSLQMYGEVLLDAKDHAGAKQYFERGHRLCEALAAEAPTPLIRSDLAASYYRISLTAPLLQRMRFRKKAIAMGEALCREYPHVALFRQLLQVFRTM